MEKGERWLRRVMLLCLSLTGVLLVVVLRLEYRGQLQLGSEPAGAVVYIDGRYQGETPFAQAVTSGLRFVELRKPGFRRWKQQIQIRTNRARKIDVVLEKQKKPK